jgi:DNA-binding LacI/PurR family transcriptional regulator
MPDSPRVTLKDIACKLGVSHTTVSLALKDHHRISKKQREKIKRVAKQMGYAPDPFLLGLVAHRWKNRLAQYHGTIAWLRHWKHHQLDQAVLAKFRYHEQLWFGATRAAKRYGYQVEEVLWTETLTARRVEQILRSRGIQGILIPPHRPAPDWGDFAWHKFSIVRFGLSVPYPDTNLVTPDSFLAMAMAIKRIREYGYKRIGIVIAELDIGLGGNFCGGFMSSQFYLHLKPAIPPLMSNIDRYLENPQRENRALGQWLGKYQPDAILVSEGQVVKQIRELGYRIPKDVAVAATSVHDMDLDAGIDQRAEAVGTIAVETLVKQINFNERGEPAEPTRILVESRWQDGKSLPRRLSIQA